MQDSDAWPWRHSDKAILRRVAPASRFDDHRAIEPAAPGQSTPARSLKSGWRSSSFEISPAENQSGRSQQHGNVNDRVSHSDSGRTRIGHDSVSSLGNQAV